MAGSEAAEQAAVEAWRLSRLAIERQMDHLALAAVAESACLQAKVPAWCSQKRPNVLGKSLGVRLWS